jgi:hypothetical protein
MEKSNWIPIAALIIAVIVPFANSLFQDWLNKRSSIIESANPALAQPNATTQRGSWPLGASRFITRKGHWVVNFVQVVGGTAAIFLGLVMLALPFTGLSLMGLALAIGLLVSVQILPWIMHSSLSSARMFKAFGLLWDDAQNPHCPVDSTLMSFASHGSKGDEDCDYVSCPKCGALLPVWDSFLGGMDLHYAQNTIRDWLHKGRLGHYPTQGRC